MTLDQKREFIVELIENVEHSILRRIEDIPENWDGIELRQLIADKFAEQTARMSGRRHSEYMNTVAVKNL